MKTTLGLKLLAGAGLITDEKLHTKRTSKILTGLVYKQQKYNLLREETEGYSKLMVVLCSMPSYPTDVSQYIRQVLSLIGRFELDPNRAMDVILDAFEQQIWNLSFITLLKNFSKSSIPHILGFKFTFYHSSNSIDAGTAESGVALTPSVGDVGSKGAVRDIPSARIAVAPTLSVSSKSVPLGAVSTSLPNTTNATTTPASLYHLTAVLLAAEMISIHDMLPYMQHSLEDTASAAILKEAAFKAEIRSHGSMNLTSLEEPPVSIGKSTLSGLAPSLSAPLGYGNPQGPVPLAPIQNAMGGFGLPIAPGLGTPFLPPPNTFGLNRRLVPGAQTDSTNSAVASKLKEKEREREKEKEREKEIEKERAVLSELEAQPYADGNQLIGMISALLTMRCWALAHTLILLLHSKSEVIDVLQFPAVRVAMCDFLLWATEKVYYPLSFIRLGFSRGRKRKVLTGGIHRLLNGTESERSLLNKQQMMPYQSIITLASDMTPVLQVMRHHISRNSELFIRVSRLFEAHIKAIAPSLCLEKSAGSKMKENKQTHSQEEGVLLQPALDIIECALLPGLTVSNFNPAAPRQLWRVISLLPFQVRYSLYDLWRGAGLGKDGLGVKHSQVVMAEVTALHQARYQLKRLAKENVKAIGVKLINTSEGAPIVVYNHVLNQIESYDNLIPYMVEALKTCSALSNDVMTYCIVNQLGKDSEKLKKGDTHYSSWFSALAKFTAFFFKKYPHSELKGTGSPLLPIYILFIFVEFHLLSFF